jgi:hypothetical protein
MATRYVFPLADLMRLIAVRLSARPFQDLGDSSGRPFPPFGNLLLN